MAPKKKHKKRKTTKKKKQQKSLIRSGMKWLFVTWLWFCIGIGLLVAWHASEIPQIVDSPHFERHAAMTLKAHDGSTIARYGELKGVSVDVKDLPNHLIYAVIAVEDRRFYDHFGLDLTGIARAMVRNVKEGRVAQGGSTITQQLAKNLFLSHERTLERKIQEAILAIWMERELTKDEILTSYLNRVYLGAGAYGIDAASQTYFNKPATELTLYESAMMAGLLKAPSRYSPQNNPALAAKRAKVVLNAMKDAGYITEEEVQAQNIRGRGSLKKPVAGKGERYFTDWVTGNLDELIGTTDHNLVIQTTFVPDIQEKAENILAEILRENADRDVTQGAIVLMDRSGAILAMVGGVNYQQSQFNRATQALRPPGSAFKPFVFLTALEKDWDSYDDIEDSPIEEGEYRPKNFGEKYFGEVSLREALTHSLNTAAVRLMQDVGVGNVIKTVRKLGIQADLNSDLSLALGSSGVPLIEMVAAYGGIADEGRRVYPYAISRIKDENGKLLYIHNTDLIGRHVVSPDAARSLTDMMENVIEDGTGRGAQLPFDAAGKTGTSQDFRDAWFIGFTDKYIAGVWLGNDDNSPMQHVTGGSLPAYIWREVMLAAHKQKSSGFNRTVRYSDDEDERSIRKVMRYIFND